MKTIRFFNLTFGHLSVITIVMIAGIVQASPTNFFWINTNGGVWSEAANWTNEDATAVAPDSTGQAFYKLYFSCGGTHTAYNDFPDGFLLNRLTFGVGNARLWGNALTFTNDDANLPQVNHNGNANIYVTNDFFFATNVTFAGTSGNRLYHYGAISGPGGLTKNGAHQLMLWLETLKKTNTYAGGTIFNSGTLYGLGTHTGIVIFGTGSITVNGGSFQPQRAGAANVNEITINGGTWANGNSFGTAWYGPIILNTNFPMTGNGMIDLYGPVSGPGGIKWTDTAANRYLGLHGTNTYTGPTTVMDRSRIDYFDLFSVPPGQMNINTDAVVRLLSAGTSYIPALTLGGIDQPHGEYGAIGSSAPNQSLYFTNSVGTVTVTMMPFLDITNDSPMLAAIGQPLAVAGTNNASVVGDMWISNAANEMVVSFPATTAWTSAAVNILPTPGETNLVSVYGTNDVGMVVSDSILVISVPEPVAAGAAAAIGYATFAIRRRRR